MTKDEIIKQAVQIGPILRVDTWLELKKFMLNTIPASARSNFSTRDPKTKKQSLNKFEKKLIDSYYSATGQLLIEEQ